MKNVTKFGLIAFTLMASLSACDFLSTSSDKNLKDTIKKDTTALDALATDSSKLEQAKIKADSSTINPQKK